LTSWIDGIVLKIFPQKMEQTNGENGGKWRQMAILTQITEVYTHRH
jgi:hypothetical protein